MSDLVALDVQTPGSNGAANFIQGAGAKSDLDSAHLQQANAAISLMGQVALGSMGGDINGKADPAKWAQGQALLKAHGIDMSAYGPDAAPTLARASVSTLGQLQQASSQRDFEMTMAKFADAMKQQGAENVRADQALANQTKQVNYETDPSRFQGSSLDAQAWNVVNDPKADPSSAQYAAAYSVLTQPRTQLVQGPDGMVPVQVAPTLPANVRAPTGGSRASGAPAPTPSSSADTPMPAPTAAPAGGGNVTIGTPVAGTGSKPTEQQMRNKELVNVVKPQVDILTQTWGQMSNLGDQALDKVWGGNFLQSEDYQRGRAALKTIVASYLYSVSGATANPGEVENQTDVLTPKPGDKPQTIRDKLDRVQKMVEAMNIATTSSGVVPPTTTPAGQPSLNDLKSKYGLN